MSERTLVPDELPRAPDESVQSLVEGMWRDFGLDVGPTVAAIEAGFRTGNIVRYDVDPRCPSEVAADEVAAAAMATQSVAEN